VYTERIKNGLINANPDIAAINEKPGMLLLDGDNGLGAVVGTAAMEKCIERAAANGVCFCSVRRANHFGIAAYYTLRAVRQNMIGFASQNNPPAIAPWGGITAMIGTNPFSIAVPAGAHEPIVLDCSCSKVARGKINVAEIEGRPIPEGWAIDSKGRPTTDATEALEGSVLPFGEYKGYGIAMIIDVLCGILSGSAYGTHVGALWNNPKTTQNLGLTFAAIDVSSFMDPSEFKTQTDRMIEELKAGKRAEGVDEILVPGEIEFRATERNEKTGISIGQGVLNDLKELKEVFAVDYDIEDRIAGK
jgi:LDH2 family malate/lactate/ureidoglycolate dehydrogenase